MIQSNINLLDSLSSESNWLQIRNFVKIPDDQLKSLNSIPEWSSNQVELTLNKLSSTLEKSNKNTSENHATDLKENSTTIATLKISKNTDTVKEYDTLPKGKEKHILKRSSSLSSLSICESNCFVNLKRSYSFPEMNTSAVLSSSPNKHFEIGSHVEESGLKTKKVISSSHNAEEASNETLDMIKSQFANSAIQCQMSQSSQPNFEETCLEKVILPSINVCIINQRKKEKLGLKPDESQGFLVDAVDEIKDSSDTVPSKIDLKKNERSNNIAVIEKDVEESFVSQPIPCAQPSLPKENIIQMHIPDTESNIEMDSSDKRIHQLAGKRKKKARKEKTKKFKSTAPDSEIQYSHSQIKSMIDLIEIFNKL